MPRILIKLRTGVREEEQRYFGLMLLRIRKGGKKSWSGEERREIKHLSYLKGFVKLEKNNPLNKITCRSSPVVPHNTHARAPFLLDVTCLGTNH